MINNTSTTTLKTLKVRVRDKHASILREWAFECNQIWNNANEFTSEYSYIPIPEVGYVSTFFSDYDLAKQQADYKKARGFTIHSGTTQEVTKYHAKARKQFKKNKLRWRTSGGSKRSLGWVPFRKGAVSWKNGQVYYNKHYFNVWDSYGLSKYQFRSGSFSEDSRGRWYLNILVEVPVVMSTGKGQIGIDLGLKDTATCSNGEKLERGNFYRNMEEKLAKAQRAKKKDRVRAIHAKIKNKRKDTLHKFTTNLINANELIVIGDVKSSSLAKTTMAKSIYDAGWYMLKTYLKYKAIARSVVFLEVNESYSTQTCSCCGSISSNSPKGRSGLGIREWECSDCGTLHDRDINAATNILAAGHCRLAGGISSV